MKKLILSLILVVALSGCITPGDGTITPIQYKNDIITVEDYSASPLNPYSGSAATMEFTVKNNGDQKVDWVEVSFFDLPGFSVLSLDCEGKGEENKFWSKSPCETNAACIAKDASEFCDPDLSKCVKGCRFTDVESLDYRYIGMTMNAPIVSSSRSFTASYSVKYFMTGFRKADIPVIDDITRKKPLGRFTQSSATYGPILAEFVLPVTSEVKTGTQITKEYWIVPNRPFELKMNFKHVGSTSVGKVQPIKINEGDVRIDLRDSIEVASGLMCDFKSTGDNNILVSDKDLENLLNPATLRCNFKVKSIDVPETLATLWMDFSYTYEYIRTETFTVLPSEIS